MQGLFDEPLTLLQSVSDTTSLHVITLEVYSAQIISQTRTISFPITFLRNETVYNVTVILNDIIP